MDAASFGRMMPRKFGRHSPLVRNAITYAVFVISTFCSVSAFSQSFPAEEETLRQTLRQFSIRHQLSADERKRAVDAFLAVDPFTLKANWRTCFLLNRLDRDALIGDLGDVRKIRGQFEKLPRGDRSQLDPHVLRQIARYFAFDTFAVAGSRDEPIPAHFDKGALRNYWSTSIRNLKESEDTYLLITKRYDLKHAITALSLFEQAKVMRLRGKFSESLAVFRQFERIDPKFVYALETLDQATGEARAELELWKQNQLSFFRTARYELSGEMLLAVLGLPATQRNIELQNLAQKYPDNERIIEFSEYYLESRTLNYDQLDQSHLYRALHRLKNIGDLPEEAAQTVVDKFMEIDAFKLDPLWRTCILLNRLHWNHLHKNEKDSEEIRERLLALPKSRRSNLDVNVLMRIQDQAQYPESAEEILQHIVANYDLKYCESARALLELAHRKKSIGDEKEAQKTFNRFLNINMYDLYAEDMLDTNTGQRIRREEILETARQKLEASRMRLLEQQNRSPLSWIIVIVVASVLLIQALRFLVKIRWRNRDWVSAPVIPFVMLALVFVALIWSAIEPHDRFTWFLEVVPVLIGVPILAWLWKRFPLTNLLCVLLAIHAMILIVGGHYTYAQVPFGNWLSETFNLGRNHYDRIGHFAQGFIPAILVREILLRNTTLKGGIWLFLIIVFSVTGFSAMYELFEWITAELTGESAEAFLGTQGDVWDTQKDMLLALIGTVSSLLLLSRWHDRQLATMVSKRAI